MYKQTNKPKFSKLAIERRTPENPLRGSLLIRVNFSKFGLRFKIIRVKIANFGKNLTPVFRVNPTDFRRLV